jgi:hypothetical protein
METRLQALLASTDYTPLGKVSSYDIYKLLNSLKLEKTCGLGVITNEWLRHLLRGPLVHLTYLFNHRIPLPHFSKPWK